MKLSLTVFSVLIYLFYPPVFAGQIALSFDDAPRGSTSFFQGTERTDRLIKALSDARVDQAIFFATTKSLHDPSHKTRLEKYASAGHLIANHTHSHKRPDSIGVENYIADIKIADSKLRNHKNFAPYFRYPYLDYGKEIPTRDFIRHALKTMGYVNGYVTVDNADWYMDVLLQNAVAAGKIAHHDNLRQAYIEALWDSIQFYDDLAIKVIGRSPKHVLLLHENDLAALYLKDLVDRIRLNGWKIISPLEAYRDQLMFITPDTLKNNNGRIAAIAHAQGYKGRKSDFYQNKGNVERLFDERNVFE